MKKVPKVVRVKPIRAVAHVSLTNPRFTAGYISNRDDGWWRWGVYVPVIIADARYYTITRKPARGKARAS